MHPKPPEKEAHKQEAYKPAYFAPAAHKVHRWQEQDCTALHHKGCYRPPQTVQPAFLNFLQ